MTSSNQENQVSKGGDQGDIQKVKSGVLSPNRKNSQKAPGRSLQKTRAHQTQPASTSYIGIGVGWTSPGSGGVDSGVTGSGGGTLGLVAMFFFQAGFDEASG